MPTTVGLFETKQKLSELVERASRGRMIVKMKGHPTTFLKTKGERQVERRYPTMLLKTSQLRSGDLVVAQGRHE